MSTKHQCDRCGCEVDQSDAMSDGSYRCDECFTFFSELNWYDPDNREERIEDYMKMKREDGGQDGWKLVPQGGHTDG